ncbi:hypothetical protein Ahy_B10g100634 [Arachis hypogaea]|uniref:Uncharacterized protein n=1 Tax=Arachis hypogaea TaxID=3818 RepID=A0A444WXC2_ARAHY|nr:hypothetical protein Ahy_B10g100634 [Arachis hypogaea]
MKIHAETRQRWFEKWALHFIWDAEYDLAIRKIFDYRMGRRLQQMLDDSRPTDALAPTGGKEGLVHSLGERCGVQASVTSEWSSKYIDDSVIFMKTKARLSKPLGREATLAETFKYTHTLKKNKARFVDQRPQDHYDAADGSAASVVDPDAVWRETVSTPYKNRIYGMGLFFASSLRTSTLRTSSGSATNRDVQLEEGVDLRLQVQELQHSLHQQA